MSIHDEFERAVAESSRKGHSPLAWLLMSLALFVGVGVVGVGFAMSRVAHRVEDMIAGFDYDAGEAAANVVARLESHTRLLSAEPDEGLSFLQNLDGSDPSQAIMGEIFEGDSGGDAFVGDLVDLARIDEQSGSYGAGAGDVSIDLHRGGNGGSLVIRSDGGDVRLDLRRTDDGASLVIDSDEGQARVGLQRTENGGYLTVDADGRSVRFDLVQSDEGGLLLVQTDGGETLRLAFGDDVQALPGWVPQLAGMPERPRPLYSLSGDQGTLGAVAWEQDISARAALESFQAQLENDGYDIRAEHHRSGARFDEGSLWARDEASGRLVFVVAHETVDGTKLLVGFGEEAR